MPFGLKYKWRPRRNDLLVVSKLRSLTLPTLSRRQMSGTCIALFILAGAIVGYGSQLQRSPLAGPTDYSISSRPIANPGAQKQDTVLSNTDTSGPLPRSSDPTSFGGRMVELQGYITIRVDNAKVVTDQATRLAASLGGYVASSSFDDSRSSESIVIRVPEDNFSLAMRNLSILGIVKAQSISSSEVTEQYVNLQAQLDSYKAARATLFRILNSSTNVKDALDTENAIQNVEAQINRIEGQLRIMQRLVAFATINLQLTEVSKPTLDFGDAILTALQVFYTVTRGMLILGASLIPVATIAGIVYVPYKYFSKKLRSSD